MKKYLLLTLAIIFSALYSSAQITGSTDACSGYVYDYSVNVGGATSYTWTLPSGWILLTGQGTSQVHVLCNTSVGQVCVDAFDGVGTLISNSCLTVIWGGGGTGWDATQAVVTPCNCSPFVIGVAPNSGSCPGTCGTGNPSPNLLFAVYDNMWGPGVYQGPADNSTNYFPPLGGGMFTWYVYQIDTSLGLNNAVLISGGTCGAPVNNTVPVFGCMPAFNPVLVNPSPVCIGDTFTVSDPNGSTIFDSWYSPDPQLTILASTDPYSTQVVATNGPGTYTIQFNGMDFFGCFIGGFGSVDVQVCNAPPTANFVADNTTICPYSCVSFTNYTSNGTTYRWQFPGAYPDTSSVQNPASICYSTSGNYDVQLIADNLYGSDTLLIPNYIHVQPIAPANNQFHNDTAFVDAGFVSYQWYYASQLLSGETNYYCPVPVSGDYSVIITDANGCQQTVVFLGLTSSISILNSNLSIGIYPNPASESLTIENYDKGNPINRIELIDQTGQTIQKYVDVIDNKITLQVKTLASGIYTLKISTIRGNTFKQIVVQN